MNVAIRAFEDRDYSRFAEIEAAIDPGLPSSADLLRECDAMHEPHVRVLRRLAE